MLGGPACCISFRFLRRSRAAYRWRQKFLRAQETKWIDSSLSECPVNRCGSRTYIVIKSFASLTLLAAVLLTAGCYHHHHDDDGWRDHDRGDRHHRRHDRDDDDRQYRDRYHR